MVLNSRPCSGFLGFPGFLAQHHGSDMLYRRQHNAKTLVKELTEHGAKSAKSPYIPTPNDSGELEHS